MLAIGISTRSGAIASCSADHEALYALDPSITCVPFNVFFANFEINLIENKHALLIYQQVWFLILCLSRCTVCIFYIHGSVHRDSILTRSNEMQQNAGVYLLQNYSTYFGCLTQEYIKL